MARQESNTSTPKEQQTLQKWRKQLSIVSKNGPYSSYADLLRQDKTAAIRLACLRTQLNKLKQDTT